jgi:heme/copper-type cytochrome/quinol oxidase subunit 2
VGGVWCIFLGVELARAETADKAQEAKKRLINVVIAIVAIMVLVFLLSFFISQVHNIFGDNPIG